MQLFSFSTLALVAVFATAVVRADAYADALAEAEAAPEAMANAFPEPQDQPNQPGQPGQQDQQTQQTQQTSRVIRVSTGTGDGGIATGAAVTAGTTSTVCAGVCFKR
ncbi:hypothetical protein BX661DRAFT_38978 [Kickxella alabastrina]|uniref:uncharacterized protein n=1 Tax=Kickxella alabastrina TaxID=61397 RepID=UPI00221EF148|nr:uncharacterized protein BX661DRAFT_38978 [Kickxella alabastrina]KAI7825490.1 hypothetical protein BX661DRAFT_38978 [Kickxella alabastrina]